MLKRVRFFHFLSFIYPKKGKKHNSFQLHNPQPESHQLTSFQKKVPSPQAETPKKRRYCNKKTNETTRNPKTTPGNNRTFSSTKSHRPSLATHNARSRLASCARTDGLQLKPPFQQGRRGMKIPVGWVNRGHYTIGWWLYHWLVG